MIPGNSILFDDFNWENLLPLTYTRSVVELRVGITTIREKWERHIGEVSIRTKGYLSGKYSLKTGPDNLYIHAGLLPTPSVLLQLEELLPGQKLMMDNHMLAFRSPSFVDNPEDLSTRNIEDPDGVVLISYPWDIFFQNGLMLRNDFTELTAGRKSQPISTTNRCICPERIFLEEGAKVELAILNASEGPIYIGRDAEIMEGAMIRGPFALCDHAVVKMGAKIYGGTTIGPWCKVAGEVQNVVFTAYSNKAHDGYLGNAVLGEWCNLGADTNSSNLKNNYEKVRAWNFRQERFIDTGLQFCGLIMGDHSKCGINTMFNTGTVVGVSANIFGAGFPRNFIPSFSWGGAGGFTEYKFPKALDTAKRVFSRRKFELSDIDQDILKHIFEHTQKYRR
jgi:UDP-N-acetylglucosamine diphosphorylase/glucosamine-1-phosphate N-acetyltransferase